MNFRKKISLFVALSILAPFSHADTIENFINIANRIPQMEIKADPKALTWARSARIVLDMTCESIAETMTQANETAKNTGNPLYCLPQGVTLDGRVLNDLIQRTWKNISSQQTVKNSMSVSQVAWIGITKEYSCQKPKSV